MIKKVIVRRKVALLHQTITYRFYKPYISTQARHCIANIQKIFISTQIFLSQHAHLSVKRTSFVLPNLLSWTNPLSASALTFLYTRFSQPKSSGKSSHIFRSVYSYHTIPSFATLRAQIINDINAESVSTSVVVRSFSTANFWSM